MNGLLRVRPLIVDLGCCSEIVRQLLRPYSWPQPGSMYLSAHCFELHPWEANTLIVAGRVTVAMSPILRDLYAQLAMPRRVIALGTCACSGELVDTLPTAEVIPVDIALPGCPPPVEALRDALIHTGRRKRT